MAIEDHSKALAVDIFNQIITQIKESRPTRTDGTATTGFVYAQLHPGEMINPRDYARPWSPIGGTPPTPGIPGPPNPGSAAPPANDGIKRAMEATFRTGEKFDKLLMVTNDGTAQWYGGGRHLGIQYMGLLAAMEACPLPERSEKDKEDIAKAQAVLFNADRTDTDTYKRYKENQIAYGKAKGEYARAQNQILSDPAQADSWGLLSDEFLAKVNQAYDTWKTQGAEAVEGALATLNSLGIPLEQGMIERARKQLESWMLPVVGTTAKAAYTYLDPSEWATLEANDIGWNTLTRAAGDYRTHYEKHGYNLSTGNWSGSSSSNSGSVGMSIVGFGFGGTYSDYESSTQSQFSDTACDGTKMTSNAEDLSIELQYGLIEIKRPWLTTDLFYMQNWFLRGERKGAISDGTIDGQVGEAGKDRRLPMLPTHVLVVRNVRITTKKWGSVQDTLTSYWNKHSGSGSSGGSSFGGNVSIPVFGPLAVTGGFSHTDGRYQGDFKDEGGNDVRADYGSWFEGDSLVINGSNIIAYLSEVLPLSPPQDDPSLPKP